MPSESKCATHDITLLIILFQIVIPQRKDGCANSIITLFHLIKCMIIPRREIKGRDTTGGQETMTALPSGSQACTLFDVVDAELPFQHYFLLFPLFLKFDCLFW